MADLNPNQQFIAELTPDIERLYERHLGNERLWEPHELVPYAVGRNYQPGDLWTPDEYPLPDAARDALMVNLLTEDNLPYYYQTIDRWSPGRDHPWSVWARQWTAEEDRHSTVIREWAHVTRALDPSALEAARREQMKGGQVPIPDGPADLLAYTTLQELATRVAHNGVGRMLDGERGGKKVMGAVAGDENLHHEFYRDLSVAAFILDASAMTIAAHDQIVGFDMPGTGIPNFVERAKRIARAGIYNFTKFREDVVAPVMEVWDIEHLEGLSPEAEMARDGLFKHLGRLDKAVAREQRQMEAAAVSA